MIRVQTEITIKRPIECCFDAARDLDLHTRTVWNHTQEKIVSANEGLIGPGEIVTFEATHFFVRQRLTSKVIDFEPPYTFTDQMQQGAFRSLIHIHEFEVLHQNETSMRDTLHFEAPYGWMGRLAERFILQSYMKNFLEYRNKQLKKMLES
nr:SRPBCC family protein [Paenibacillus sp. Marseille-Q4541]